MILFLLQQHVNGNQLLNSWPLHYQVFQDLYHAQVTSVNLSTT